MSILIKGMEMPTSCWDCPCINGENGYCQLRKEYVYGEIPRSCPLVPVPPHGRLIDADALMDWIYSDEPNAWKAPFRLCTADRSDVKFLLKQAPTIIPASEEGE